MALQGLVCGFEVGDFHRAGRTNRSLRAAGVAVEDAPTLSGEELARRLMEISGPLVLARAGAWLAGPDALEEFPSSGTGLPLVGFGAVRNDPGWERFLTHSGGDLQPRSWWPRELPEPAVLYVENAARRALADGLASGRSLREAAQHLVRNRRFRAVHLPALDAYFGSALRVLQVVTTIQIGGAERVTLDLAEELNRQGVHVAVAAFGRPTRLAFPEPPSFVSLAHVPHSPAARADAVARLACGFGADVIHAHLIRATEMQAIKARGFPLAVTLHNMPQAWPVGVREASGCADFVFACSRAVERAWSEGREDETVGAVCPPVRTIWNGIAPKVFTPTEASRAVGVAWRTDCGWAAADFIIVAVANPRPQKRLHLLPAIMHELRDRLLGRRVRLVFVGAHAEGSAEARQSVAEIDEAVARTGLAANVHWTGGIGDVAPILAAADVLVSTSAYEGLSLAHLEALAAGLPVVATDVGGTAELTCPSLHLLPIDATPADFAAVLEKLAAAPPLRATSLPSHFTRYRMAARTRRLYPRVIERAQSRPCGREIWLIANNFSTGGAQSSARRLLLGLAQRGVKVRAFTVQEAPDYPTPGRAALLAAGIPVIALPPPERMDAEDAAARILAHAAITPPQAVLFWNLITSYKILLADGFVATPIYDISPGEMYFASLAKYFAQPRPGLPYLTPRSYGARLAGVVVKYAAEAETAAQLGARVRVIRNGIACADTVPRAQLGRAKGKRAAFIIGTAARLSPDKRLEDLLEALRLALPRLPRCELHIAGGVECGAENYARELRRLARGLPVRWLGELADTAEFLSSLDLFAMISEPAGCPNASLEAMAAGLPVVATDVGGASEQVLDRVTGRLTPRRDPQALSDALRELAHDADLRARLGTAGAAHVRAQFSLEQMIESYRRLCFGVETTPPPIVAEMAVA